MQSSSSEPTLTAALAYMDAVVGAQGSRELSAHWAVVRRHVAPAAGGAGPRVSAATTALAAGAAPGTTGKHEIALVYPPEGTWESALADPVADTLASKGWSVTKVSFKQWGETPLKRMLVDNKIVVFIRFLSTIRSVTSEYIKNDHIIPAREAGAADVFFIRITGGQQDDLPRYGDFDIPLDHLIDIQHRSHYKFEPDAQASDAALINVIRARTISKGFVTKVVDAIEKVRSPRPVGAQLCGAGCGRAARHLDCTGRVPVCSDACCDRLAVPMYQ